MAKSSSVAYYETCRCQGFDIIVLGILQLEIQIIFANGYQLSSMRKYIFFSAKQNRRQVLSLSLNRAGFSFLIEFLNESLTHSLATHDGGFAVSPLTGCLKLHTVMAISAQ